MALVLWSHPFASFCQKVLIALYETGLPFEARLVDLGDETSAAAFRTLWPPAKMPVLVDDERRLTLPNRRSSSSISIAWRPTPASSRTMRRLR